MLCSSKLQLAPTHSTKYSKQLTNTHKHAPERERESALRDQISNCDRLNTLWYVQNVYILEYY